MATTWNELKTIQQRIRRLKRRDVQIKGIGKRICLVCFRDVIYGERNTKRYCSDTCRQAAHRMRRAGKWPRQMKLWRLYQRCWERVGLAGGFESARQSFNEKVVAFRPFGGMPEDMLKSVMGAMLAADRELKRKGATMRTVERVLAAAFKLRRG